MRETDLQEGEIIVSANPVRYHDIAYFDDYIVVTQHRTRRRIYNGFYFEDTGSHIYLSTFVSGIFQCKRKERKFIVNTITKEWRDYTLTLVKHHHPEKKEPIPNNIINTLEK